MTAFPETPESLSDTDGASAGPGRALTYFGVVAFMTAFAVPMSFFYFVFPPMLRSLGHGPEIIGAFAMVYLPYVLRGLWAFAIERVMQGQAARYRIATVGLALFGVVLVLGLLFIDPLQNVAAAMAIAVVIFIVFASGMTTLDGYLLATLSAKDRADSAAWSAGGVAFGGIAVGFMAWFDVFSGSWTGAIFILAGATALPSLLILILPTARGAEITAHEDVAPDVGKLRQFFSAGPLRALVLMALIAHGTMGLLSGYLPVLQIDAGLSLGEIGLFSAIGSNVMGLIGAMLGGWLLTRIGGWKTLVVVMALLVVGLTAAAFFNQMFWGKGFAIAMTALLMMAGYIYFVPYRALTLAACEGPGSVSRVAILSSFDMSMGIVGMSLAGVAAVQLGLSLFFAMGACLAALAALFALKNAASAASHSSPTP